MVRLVHRFPSWTPILKERIPSTALGVERRLARSGHPLEERYGARYGGNRVRPIGRSPNNETNESRRVLPACIVRGTVSKSNHPVQPPRGITSPLSPELTGPIVRPVAAKRDALVRDYNRTAHVQSRNQNHERRAEASTDKRPNRDSSRAFRRTPAPRCGPQRLGHVASKGLHRSVLRSPRRSAASHSA